jgi:hypothetical protein
MAKVQFTDAHLKGAIRQAAVENKEKWVSDPTAKRGKGCLQFRASPAGAHRWYWRYTLADGGTARIGLGVYGERQGELTLAKARDAADAKSALYRNPESRDVRAYETQQEQARKDAIEAARRAEEGNRKADIARREHSLTRLLAEYVAHLEKRGKFDAAHAAKGLFRNHLETAFPEYAALPAADIKPVQITEMLRRLLDLGKGRAAGKLRSYVRAA